MFKTTSLFLKVVCLNNTFNLSLISSAYNDSDFSYKNYSGRKPQKFGSSWGGGQTRTERFHIFHVFFWGHSPCIKNWAQYNS